VSDERDLLPHDRLIDELHSLCVTGRSGTMFIITGENHAAQFVLRGGQIICLTYWLLRGLGALPSMRTFGRYRFQEETVDRTDPRLPPTPDLLALLLPNTPRRWGRSRPSRRQITRDPVA
jgi:hypothetical protein